MTDIPDLSSPREVKALLEKHGLQPRKQLGQNFLVDGNIVRKIIAAVGAEEGDSVVEVGPGAGVLTVALAHLGTNLLALEIDRGLASMLEDLLKPWPGARIIRCDVLKINWRELISDYFITPETVKLVSNLPYVISGPFMYGLFKEGFPFKTAILMLQKEVAHRLVANPGDSDYGGLSVLSRYYTEGKVLFNVSNNVFWPRPKVGSAVLHLQPRNRMLNEVEEKLFWYLVQGVFEQRRKTMFNNMVRIFPGLRSKMHDLFSEASIEPNARPEDLSVERFAMLTQITYNYDE